MILDFIGALLYIGIIYIVGQWTVGWLYKNEKDTIVDWLSFAVGFSEQIGRASCRERVLPPV